MVQSCKELYGVKKCRTEIYRIVLGPTDLYGVVQHRTELYGVVQCSTELYESYTNIQNSSRLYRIVRSGTVS